MSRRAMVARVKLHPNLLQKRPLRPPRRPRFPRLHLAGRKKRKTFSSMADPKPQYTAVVVTVSDSCSRGTREDRSGPAVAQLLEQLHFPVIAREVIPDDRIQI